MSDAAPPEPPRKSAANTPIRGKPFKPGNPGKPKGARHRTTLAAQALLDGEAEALTRKCVELALQGDTVAMRLALERILPPTRERTVDFPAPRITSPADLPSAVLSIMEAVAAGDITPGEATQLAGILEQYRKQSETAELAARIAALEEGSVHDR